MGLTERTKVFHHSAITEMFIKQSFFFGKRKKKKSWTKGVASEMHSHGIHHTWNRQRISTGSDNVSIWLDSIANVLLLM